MDSNVGYDLDGVLSENFKSTSTKSYFKMNGAERKAWRTAQIEHYQNGKPLYIPPESSFVVITARKFRPEDQDMMQQWLVKHLPEKNMITEMFTGKFKNYEAVIKFKAKIIEQRGITKYTEDNLVVLKGLHRLLPEVELFWFNGIEPIPYPLQK